MQLMFRQGIVRKQSPFLVKSGSSIQLQTTNSPFVVSCSHGTSEYLFTEPTQQGTVTAWTNLPTTRSYWLYTDFDKITGARTFGYTTSDWLLGQTSTPSDEEGKLWFDNTSRVIRRCTRVMNPNGTPLLTPSGTQVYQWVAETPVENQHCFDVIQNKMLVYVDNRWIDKIRVFVAFVLNGVSVQEQNIGSQVGLIGNYFSGKVMFDGHGKAIRKRDGSFLTTEDQWFVDGSNIQASRLEADVHQALAEEVIPKFSVVRYGDFDRVRLARYEDTGSSILAVAMNDGTHDQIINLVVQGTVTNTSWDWPRVNAELWVDNAGALTTVNPSITDSLRGQHVPVARVIGRTSIFFEQGLGGIGEGTSDTIIPETIKATTTVHGVSRLSTPATVLGDPVVVSDTDPRLTNARTPTTHSHPATQITTTVFDTLSGSNVQVNIEELQTQKLSKQGGTLYGYLTLHAHPSQPLHASTKQYVDDRVHGLLSSQSADLAYVNIVGDTMTGYLTLSGDPVESRHAATKQYVDNGLLPKADITYVDNGLATKADITYVDNGLATKADITHTHTLDSLSNVDSTGKSNGDVLLWNDTVQMWTVGNVSIDTSSLVQKIGDTMTGFLTLNSDPTADLHAATKQYVDHTQIIATFQVGSVAPTHVHYAHLFRPEAEQLILGTTEQVVLTPVEVEGHTHVLTIEYNTSTASFEVVDISNNELDNHEAFVIDYGRVDPDQFVSRNGDTMVGSLILADDPIEPLEAVTKQYVDNALQMSVPYDLSFFIAGEIDVFDTIVGSVLITRPLTIDKNFGFSMAYSHAAPIQDTITLLIRKNTTVIGRIEFNPYSNTGVFFSAISYDPYDPYSTPPEDFSFLPGDRVDIVSSPEDPYASVDYPVNLLDTVITIVGCAQLTNCTSSAGSG